ncbi:MAG: protein kinase [Planctomycetota bacterium]
MREKLICPECENVFHLEVDETRTEVPCPRCGHSFVHITSGADIDAEADTVFIPEQPQKPPPAPPAEEKATEIEGDPEPGMIFGNYEIIEEIARGASGIVYKAKQRNLDRVVALKVLIAGETASEEQIKRFHHEAKAVARLRHPNIVPIYDVGVHKGKHYFAMEYVDGKPLHKMMKKKRLPPNESLDIIVKVAQAIAAAHEAHIIHRDIKPANVMIDNAGRVQVMDFGLAKQVEADTQYTRSGTTMGTPNYMPIEQAQGDVKNIDERSDIYSLGAVLYEMLTGVPPFVAETNLKTILKVINEEPILPRRRNPYIHKDIETICMKAMYKDRERRYATVLEFIDDIRRFRAGEPILARPPSMIYRLSKKIRKHRAVITTSLSTIVLGVLVVWAIGYFFPPQPPPPPNGLHPPAEKRRLIEYISFTEKDVTALIGRATREQAFLPAIIRDSELPEDVEIKMDIEVKPDITDDSRIGFYLYGDSPGPAGSYLRGYALVFFFVNGRLNRLEFQRGDSPRGPGWANLDIEPKDGKIHCSVTIKNGRISPVIDGRKLTPYSIDDQDIVKENERMPGAGLLLYGKGLTFAPGSLKLEEIIPPPERLLEDAFTYYNARSWEKARTRYFKFLNVYGGERGSPDSDIIECERRIAFSYALESRVLEDRDFDGRLAVGAVNDLNDIAKKYYGNEKYRGYAQEAATWAAAIQLCLDDEADLAGLAGKLARKYGISQIEAGREILAIIGVSKIETILGRTTDVDDFTIELYRSHAEKVRGRGDFAGSAGIYLLCASYYIESREWDRAREICERVKEIVEDRYPLRSFEIKADVLLASIFREQGDFPQYRRHMSEIRVRYRVVDPETEKVVFQPELARAVLTYARDVLHESLKDRQRPLLSLEYFRECIDCLWEFYFIASPEIKHIPTEPDVTGLGPEEKARVLNEYELRKKEAGEWRQLPGNADKVKLYNQWLEIVFAARRTLIRVRMIETVLYPENAQTAEDIISLAEDYPEKATVPAHIKAELALMSGEVLQHFKRHEKARQVFEDVRISFANEPLLCIEAVSRIVESYIVEGYSGNGDAGDIDLPAVLEILYELNRYPDHREEFREAQLNAKTRAVLAMMLQHISRGRDPDGTPNEYGEKLHRQIADSLAEIRNDMERLAPLSYIRIIYGLLTLQEPLDPEFAEDYLEAARSLVADDRKNEIKFWFGVQLLYFDRKEEAHRYFEEILRDDVLLEHWYSRFLSVYLKPR